jgi:hypothetical protein
MRGVFKWSLSPGHMYYITHVTFTTRIGARGLFSNGARGCYITYDHKMRAGFLNGAHGFLQYHSPGLSMTINGAMFHHVFYVAHLTHLDFFQKPCARHLSSPGLTLERVPNFALGRGHMAPMRPTPPGFGGLVP